MDTDGEAILTTDGVTLVTDGEATRAMHGAVIQATGEDLRTDTIITPTITEEEVLLLITAEEIMPQTETILTETTVIETSQTEVTAVIEIVILQIEEASIPISEEVLLQMAEQQQIQLLQTEVIPKAKITAMITLTEDHQALQQETTTTLQTAAHQEATLPAHHVL